jgi:hypothetical protein
MSLGIQVLDTFTCLVQFPATRQTRSFAKICFTETFGPNEETPQVTKT